MRIHFFKTCLSLLRWSSIALLFTTASFAQAQVQGATDNEIVIGSIQDISGPVASVGGPMRDGMILGVEEINAAGGINGRKLRLQVEDSGYDPKKGVLAAQKLLSQDKVFALVGVFGSAVVQATQPMTIDRGVPYLFPLAASDISYLPHSPLKFGAYAVSSEHMRAAVEYAYVTLGKRRFGILYQDDETGQAAFRAAEEQLKVHGLTFLEQTSYKRGETNFAAQIARLKAANVDVVALGTAVRETPAAAVEAKAQSWQVDMIVNGGVIGAVIALGGKAVEGLYGATQFPNVGSDMSPGFKAIAERFKTRFGRDIGDGADYGHTIVMLFAEGAKNAGRNLTPQTMTLGLEKVKNFKSAFSAPPFSYSADNHAPPREALIMQVRGGKWVSIGGPITYDNRMK